MGRSSPGGIDEETIMRSTRTILASIAAAVIFGTGVAGCTSGGYLRMPSLQALSRQTEAEEPIAFAVTGPVQVDVESFGGNVTILADEEATGATVTFTRDARHGFMREDEAEASLQQIHTSAELLNTETGEVIQVRASTDHDQPYQQRAHVTIIAPAISDVRVRTSSGSVMAEMMRGAIDIESGGGDVRVMTEFPMTEQVTIVNKDGDIDYRVRGESTAAFDAQTIRGRVLQRVRNGKLIIDAATDHDSLIATLNGGDNPVVLRTVDGNIRIAVVSDPTRVGAMIIDP